MRDQFEHALKRLVRESVFGTADEALELPSMQLIVIMDLPSGDTMPTISALSADKVSTLVVVPGIVISTSTVAAKPISYHLVCRNCMHSKTMPANFGFSGIQLPRVCEQYDHIHLFLGRLKRVAGQQILGFTKRSVPWTRTLSSRTSVCVSISK